MTRGARLSAVCVLAFFVVMLEQNTAYQPNPGWRAPEAAASKPNPLAKRPEAAAGGKKLFLVGGAYRQSPPTSWSRRESRKHRIGKNVVSERNCPKPLHIRFDSESTVLVDTARAHDRSKFWVQALSQLPI